MTLVLFLTVSAISKRVNNFFLFWARKTFSHKADIVENRAFAYTMLMQKMLDAGDVQGVLNLHGDLSKLEKLKPDMAMFTQSIKAYTLAQKFAEAWEIWEYVRSQVGRPSGHLYSVMFGLCDRVSLF